MYSSSVVISLRCQIQLCKKDPGIQYNMLRTFSCTCCRHQCHPPHAPSAHAPIGSARHPFGGNIAVLPLFPICADLHPHLPQLNSQEGNFLHMVIHLHRSLTNAHYKKTPTNIHLKKLKTRHTQARCKSPLIIIFCNSCPLSCKNWLTSISQSKLHQALERLTDRGISVRRFI